MEVTTSEKVLVIDYGGQYTHLISRRCRELGVFAEIIPQDTILTDKLLEGVKGAILSGGPRTVNEDDIGSVFSDNLKIIKINNIKILGICFGHQLLAVHFGGGLDPGGNPEYGQTDVEVVDSSILVNGLQKKQQVWMSHSDEVNKLPDGMKALVISGEGRIAAFANADNSIFGVQFHPEVTHTPNGLSILDAFLKKICSFRADWKPEDQVGSIVEYVKETVGESRVLMGTSGGVDSTVAAYFIRKAIGTRLYCVFVDNGLLRNGEREEVETAFEEMGFEHFVSIDAADEFVDALEGVEDPEEKRRIIADKFIEVFERKAKELENKFGEFEFLGQGTIYPDRVESAATGNATAVIKSHHNVRLPDWMKLKLVEPLRDLYKDEVRQVGFAIDIPKKMITRQPFPGPSLAIRISGPVTREQLAILRHADVILHETISDEAFYPEIWQSFCVLLPVRTVGVMGDERTYDQAIVIRMVESLDAMTASVSTPPWHILLLAASRIANEVKGVNRVVYDLTSKPPGTIEWY
ncbi:MAG: glutamine-hydrolyzing GMP synthase [Candidatus Thorarchaeota archaeon]